MKNDTLKEYYVKLENLWNNALNVLTAINQSLHTNASEVTVNISDGNYGSSSIRIPSFLYLENKLENLNNNFSNLFNLPKSGEAWFSANDSTNMYKLELVKSSSAPLSPIIEKNNIVASLTDNNFLKDLVSPKTYLRLNISNLPDNISNIFMKKLVVFDQNIFNSLSNKKDLTYEDASNMLASLKKGIDYEEYDSVLNSPIKRDKFRSEFKIINIPQLNDSANPWIDSTNGNSSRYTYIVELDTLKYSDQEDSSIEFTLKIGDKICLGNELAIFKVKSINHSTNSITIEETVGHTTLQTFGENSSMIFTIWNTDYSEYHYIDVPLEENPYICVFLGTIYNNVRSILSNAILFNLHEILMTDANGQYIYDDNGNKLTYMQYYDKYCINIGDLILGLTQSAYPQLSFLNNNQLESLQNSISIKNYVSKSIDPTTILQVVPINKHIIENTTTEEVVSLHAQKNELNSKINSINNSISNTTNQLLTTDFSQDVAVTHQSLQTQLTQYYDERVLLQKQMIAVVENINTNVANISGKKDIKYHIRGIAAVDEFETFLHSTYSEKLDIIGIDVEYKYKALNKQQTSPISINSNIFTDWNKLITIDKQRILEFNSLTGSYSLKFENYNSTNNIIKWNQIDIPICADEDVIIRIRFKYNIGQPFIDLYSPWSDEITVIFPTEFKDNVEINSIISENQNDIIGAKFHATLINDGYYEHVTNSLIVNDNHFFHMPENIYSGFNTSDNKLISLRDKLQELTTAVETYKSLIDNELNQKYELYLTYDDVTINLLNNTTNKVNVYNTEHILNSFIRKDMNIVIKNVGDVPVKLYSIFPGNINTPLLLSNDGFYERNIGNYERVPIIENDQMTWQRMGQWIYFRQNNAWTGKDIYYNNKAQNISDVAAAINNDESVEWNGNISMKDDNNQILFGFRSRGDAIENNNYHYENKNNWIGIKYDALTNSFTKLLNEKHIDSSVESLQYEQKPIEFFMYDNLTNDYLMRYEDIFYNDNGNRIYLDHKTSITDFVSQNDVPGKFSDDSDFCGAFLYPNIDNINNILTTGGIQDFVEIESGKTLSIPITLEFYLNSDTTNITKSLYFDIKSSLHKNVEHYMIEITSMYDFTSSGNTIKKQSLIDETTLDNTLFTN